jgi:hypothetical protein
MIDQKVFAKEMDQYWIKDLGNVSSDALRQVWYQQTQNFYYYAIGDSQRGERTALQPQTGTGETTNNMELVGGIEPPAYLFRKNAIRL